MKKSSMHEESWSLEHCPWDQIPLTVGISASRTMVGMEGS